MRRQREAGVTLLEVLVVLAIIAMITAVAAPRLLDNFGRAKSHTALVELANVKAGLQLFYVDVGRYPTQGEGLGALLLAPRGVTGWDGPYLDQDASIDPWGRTYEYRIPGVDRDFDVFSLGRDGQPGGQKEDKDISL